MSVARKAIYQRLKGATALTALLSRDPQDPSVPAIYQGWPFGVLEGPDPRYFPRVTFLVADDSPINEPVAELDVQLDEWVWHDGSTGGFGRLEAVDEQIVALFNEAEWITDGRKAHSTIGSARDFGRTVADQPLRRMRALAILIS